MKIDGDSLTKKVGPLPVWAYGGIAAAVAGYIIWRRRALAAATTANAVASPDQTGTAAFDPASQTGSGSSIGPDGNGYTGQGFDPIAALTPAQIQALADRLAAIATQHSPGTSSVPVVRHNPIFPRPFSPTGTGWSPVRPGGGTGVIPTTGVVLPLPNRRVNTLAGIGIR